MLYLLPNYKSLSLPPALSLSRPPSVCAGAVYVCVLSYVCVCVSVLACGWCVEARDWRGMSSLTVLFPHHFFLGNRVSH